jgi:SOS-response transcriptional repressor LexA
MSASHFSYRVKKFRETHKLTQQDLGRIMHVGGNYISMLEMGKKEPSPTLEALFSSLETHYRSDLLAERPSLPLDDNYSVRKSAISGPITNSAKNLFSVPLRQIPVISWAMAGEAHDFDELPKDWQEAVPTTVGDPKAFALRIQGNSMEPEIREGDIAVLLPSIPARNGDLVVAVIEELGVVCKRLNTPGGTFDTLELISSNPDYRTITIHRRQLRWMYPVDSIVRKMRR